MPTTPVGLNDCTWDSASSAFFRWGSTKIPLTKFTPAKDEIKTERVRRVGEMRARKRTPGVSELGDIAVELLATDYVQFIIPRMPIHGGTLVEFIITASVYHPSVAGSYGILCDGCRIVGQEGPEFEASEKGLIKKLSISVIDVWEKGSDNKWKTLALKPLPSSQAVAAMQF